MVISKFIGIVVIIKRPAQFPNLQAFLRCSDPLLLLCLRTADGVIVILLKEEGGLTVKRASSPRKFLSRTQPGALFLNFWSARYIFFRASMPPMEKLYDGLRRRAAEIRVKFLCPALDRQRASLARSFLQKIKLSYLQPWAPFPLVCSDFLCSTQELASARKIQEIPVVYSFNHPGKIVHVNVTSKEEPAGELEKTLAIFLQGEK